MVNIIVAVADNWAIGKDNQLLWHISEDLKFFKRTTLGCSVVMGRRTFESIGRPLPKRTNIVVSRGFDAPEGVLVASSLEQALELAGGGSCESDVFVIGGGQIYAQSIDLAQKLYITHVHTVIEDADAFYLEVLQLIGGRRNNVYIRGNWEKVYSKECFESSQSSILLEGMHF
jgi:dihydrofolate reductase